MILRLFLIVVTSLILTVSPISALEFNNPDEHSRIVLGQTSTVAQDERLESLVVIGGSAAVHGKIDTRVAIGSTVTLSSTAEVAEELTTVGSSLQQETGAKTPQKTTDVTLPPVQTIGQGMAGVAALWMLALWWKVGSILSLGILAWLVGILFINGAPLFYRSSMNYLAESTGSAFGRGLLTQMGFVFIVVLLVITIVGILFLPVLLIAFGLALLLGFILAADFVGDKLRKNKPTSDILRLGIGILALSLVRLVPWAGEFLVFLLSTSGLGAILTGIVRLIRETRGKLPPQLSSNQ